MIAVVEAKASHRRATDGLQQAKQYAEMLDLRFAFATNGQEIVEFDYLTGQERLIDAFPTPAQLWDRLHRELSISKPDDQERLLAPSLPLIGKPLRYYQEVAINRTLAAILGGQQRVLLTMATGTGKTDVAFHLCWKLWSTRWTRTGEARRPRILFLSDRSILVDDPKDKQFASFGDARWKISGEAHKGREMYFATYQAIAADSSRPGLYKEYESGFFDLIVIDECHRGSARDESNWRDILEHFSPAFQVGMTATPLREDNRDTYEYFGSPIYAYSLKQGIDDGFLAPYRVHRIVTDVDATGWRPSVAERDRYGRLIPDEPYTTADFERIVALRARTQAIAGSIARFMRSTDPFAKTIVFCVDQEHADEMRQALAGEMQDYVRRHPDYIARVVSDEGDVGRGYLSKFQDIERVTPVVLTTSRLLTTGVDAPTCKNIVLARPVNSMTEFKQIIGRGTRVRSDHGKLWFSILDYTGSATRLFADPAFDGEPIDPPTETNVEDEVPVSSGERDQAPSKAGPLITPIDEEQRRKFYVDGGAVEVAAHIVYELDAQGRQLRIVRYTDYTAEKVRELWTSADDLRRQWVDSARRKDIITALEARGVSLSQLEDATNIRETDAFDLLCHFAFSTPLRSRRERAERLRKGRPDFWERFRPDAREILNEILEKYIEHGSSELTVPEVLKVAPLSRFGNVLEIADRFGGPAAMRDAFSTLQTLLYSDAA